jgi:hypothetical protein
MSATPRPGDHDLGAVIAYSSSPLSLRAAASPGISKALPVKESTSSRCWTDQTMQVSVTATKYIKWIRPSFRGPSATVPDHSLHIQPTAKRNCLI